MAEATNAELIAAGMSLAEAGKTSAAIALWQQAARRGSVDGFFNIGTLYMKLAFATDNPERQQAYIVSAVTAFTPIAAPQFKAPDAAFSLGMIAEHVGDEVKAANYFQQAAAMPHGLNPEQDAPTQAMLKLAGYALHGRGGLIQDAAVAEGWILRAQVRHADLFAEPQSKPRPMRPTPEQGAKSAMPKA